MSALGGADSLGSAYSSSSSANLLAPKSGSSISPGFFADTVHAGVRDGCRCRGACHVAKKCDAVQE